MRPRHQLAASLAIAALGVGVGCSWAAATAGTARISPLYRTPDAQSTSSPVSAARVCYSQNDDDNGVGVVSQNFEADFDAYDSRAADDFTIDRRCTVRKVRVDGAYFGGIGPARSIQVTFYRDAGTTPGTRLADQNRLSFGDPSGLGNFTIPLTRPVTLRPGTYWVAVRANIDFRVGGEWGWNTNNTLRGSLAQWKNPGDGFDSGCTTWGDILSCLGDGDQGPDLSFALLK